MTRPGENRKLTRGELSPLTEDQFLLQVRGLAKLCGWLEYHTHDSRHSTRGFPDLILVRDGVMLAVELKIPPDLPTPEQERWLAALERVPGVTACVWYPDDWPSIQNALQR